MRRDIEGVVGGPQPKRIGRIVVERRPGLAPLVRPAHEDPVAVASGRRVEDASRPAPVTVEYPIFEQGLHLLDAGVAADGVVGGAGQSGQSGGVIGLTGDRESRVDHGVLIVKAKRRTGPRGLWSLRQVRGPVLGRGDDPVGVGTDDHSRRHGGRPINGSQVLHAGRGHLRPGR